MGRNFGRIRRAIDASSGEILACLGENLSIPSIRALHASELKDEEKDAMWDLFEKNMYELYSGSSFGWEPMKRKEEIFHGLSRFLLVQESEQKTKVVAFCMFRFENEEGENVVYCYDIQISSQYHREGMGRKLIDNLCIIGQAFGMVKIVLTVLKANANAMAFYRA